MGVGSGLYMYVVVVQKFTFAISSPDEFLFANVNWRSRSLYAVARPSVVLSVCNARAPYSGGWYFLQYFYCVLYVGHSLTSTTNFTEIVPGRPLRRRS